jgi:TPR repeat protein
LLRNAADLGFAHAQFDLGRDLELGLHGSPKDSEVAMSWYRKAAAQGDVLAVQRLEKGFLP